MRLLRASALHSVDRDHLTSTDCDPGETIIHPLQLTSGALLTSAIGAAAHLRIADALATGAKTAEELATTASCQPNQLHRLLTALTAIGIFRRRDDGRFENTEDSAPLRTDHAESIRHYCMLAATEYYRASGALLAAVLSGESAFSCAFGTTLYTHLNEHPGVAELYDRAMADLTRPVGRHLADAIDFCSARVVADIGGGRGELLTSLLARFPDLTGICVDRTDVCARARQERSDASGATLDSRLRFSDRDFFEPLGIDADIYILKNVLHNWPDEQVRALLNNVANAMARPHPPPVPRLLVVEPMKQQGPLTMPAAIGDLFQLAICERGARRRDEEDFGQLLDEAGLEVNRTVTLPTGHTVLECTRGRRD